jgi:hypothetical protein
VTSLAILTRIRKDSGHVKTKLSINWEGVDRDSLILLAQARICQRLQWQWIHEGKVPEEHHCSAAEFIQPEQATVDFSQYKQPKPARVEIGSDWMAALEALPKGEKEALIKQLEMLG